MTNLLHDVIISDKLCATNFRAAYCMRRIFIEPIAGSGGLSILGKKEINVLLNGTGLSGSSTPHL